MADDNVNADDYIGEYQDDAVAAQVAKVCKVYDSEDFFTVFVQLLLAFFGLMSLWFKRQAETPKRKFRTWFLDVSKQGLGACYAHVLNMIIAAIIVNSDDNVSNDLNDQCAWYGMTYIIDTTLGLLLAIWGLKAIDYMANEWDWVSLKHSGVYQGVDGLLHWIHQCVAWLAILTISKVIIYYFMIWTADWLSMFGDILFSPLQSNIHFELLFVMIFFPGVLNVIYFWVADHYLKAEAHHASAHEEDTLETELAQKNASLLPEGEGNDAETPKIWVTEDKPAATVV